jgi:tRNA (guanine9-N1)-methyltransferase
MTPELVNRCLTLQEVASLTSQLGYVYAANRRAIKPCSTILFTDFNHRPLQRFESIQDSSYKRWTNCEWWRESFQALWTDAPIASSSTFDSTTTLSSEVTSLPTAATPTSIEPTTTEPTTTEPAATISAPSRACKTSVVYLTADSSEELCELSPDEVYIIGGIVDHNRYKVR